MDTVTRIRSPRTHWPRGDIIGRLAELVAHPAPSFRERPFALDADNARADLFPTVAAAVASGAPFVVTVAPDVLAIDADDPAHLEALDRFAAELAADGWPVLRVASGREGHRHLFAVVPVHVARARAHDRAVSLGLPAPRSCMRPPGAPHRLGLPVHLLDCPDTFAAAVEAVRAPRVDRFEWAALLRSGQWPRDWRGDGTGSSMVWLVAVGAFRAGWSLDELRAALADPSNIGGRSYRTRLTLTGKRHADYWLDLYVAPSAATAAVHRVVVPADAVEARARLDVIRAAVLVAVWSGMAGATDRAVMLALIARGYARGSVTPHMSHREIAEAARCTRQTAARSVARLRAAGWLLVADKGRGRTVAADDGTRLERADSTRWRLVVPDARLDPTGGTPPASTSLCGTESRALEDVGRWRGIGLNGVRVLEALERGALSAGELGDVLGLNVGNLRYRLLPRLAGLGLLVNVGGRWSTVGDLAGALDAASVELGTVGKAEKVRDAHAEERAGYLEHRERTRPRREYARRRRCAAVRAARVRSVARPPHPTLFALVPPSPRWSPALTGAPPGVVPAGMPTRSVDLDAMMFG